MNTRKDNYEDVLDPYALQEGWFQIDFTTFLLVPNPALQARDFVAVEQSINRLDLNDNDYVDERITWIAKYAIGEIDWQALRDSYPFIADEIVRVNFDDTLKESMVPILKSFLYGTRF